MAKALQKMKEVTSAQVFAVTLEKKGGSETPSLDQMFVAGKVAG
jgi:anti-sigma-K factor RskA